MERRFSFRRATYVYCCLSLLIEADVNAVSSCINKVELLERWLIPSGLDMYVNATSFISPYSPSEARTSGIGWCSDDTTCNNSTERQFIEVDFHNEVIIEAVAIFRAGGSYVTHYSVEYAGSDRDYHCISNGISNKFVNGTCSLNTEPNDFAYSVTARYVRIIPIQWVGASVCLRMEFYGCTISECQTVGTHDDLPIYMVTASSTSSISNTNQVFDLSNPWCASGPVPQIIRIHFNDSVYVTQLRVTGNSVNASILFDASEELYQNNVGLTKFELFFNTIVIPLWPAVNTTQLGFQLDAGINIINPVCFGVELTGCISSQVINQSIPLLSTASVSDVDQTISTCITSSNVGRSQATSYITSTPTCITTQVVAMITTSIVIITSTVHTTISQPTTLTNNISPTVISTGTVSDAQSESTTSRISNLPTTFTTVTVTVTSTVSVTPSQYTAMPSSPSVAANQQVTDNGCNAVAICIPVAVVIALLVCIIVFLVVWRLTLIRKKAVYNLNTSINAEVRNDLYGMENRFSKADKCIYDYPAFLPEKYSDQSVTSPGSDADASTSAVMNTNNPVEETLNSDYVNYK